jgi:hypothetical protein
MVRQSVTRTRPLGVVISVSSTSVPSRYRRLLRTAGSVAVIAHQPPRWRSSNRPK